jgi:hypothetical protein
VATATVLCEKALVATAAAACAEHLCFKYADPIDPDRMAMTVESNFDYLVAQMNREAV